VSGASRRTSHNLADHPRRDELRANYLAALEYGVVGRSHAHVFRQRKSGGRVCRCGAVETMCPSCNGSGWFITFDGRTLGECSTCHGEGRVTT
jgi:CDGSH-type Zn-finger protein